MLREVAWVSPLADRGRVYEALSRKRQHRPVNPVKWPTCFLLATTPENLKKIVQQFEHTMHRIVRFAGVPGFVIVLELGSRLRGQLVDSKVAIPLTEEAFSAKLAEQYQVDYLPVMKEMAYAEGFLYQHWLGSIMEVNPAEGEKLERAMRDHFEGSGDPYDDGSMVYGPEDD